MKIEADLYIEEKIRKFKYQDKEKARRQIRQKGFDALKETLMFDSFPAMNPKVNMSRHTFIYIILSRKLKYGWLQFQSLKSLTLIPITY